MNKLITIFILLSLGVANADTTGPLANVKHDLESMLNPIEGRKNISEMKAIANDNNADVGIAFENYLIAKKNITIARAQFNPITTGHLLGISLGMNYLWAPIAVDAILSIPTKIYNVSKNKYLSKVALYNLHEAREVVNNELAHLYYDILTHEVIMKSIDEEISLLTYQETKWTENKVSEERINGLKKSLLSLGIERANVYGLYVAELAAIRTLVSTTDVNKYELAQVPTLLNKSIIANVDETKLQNYALVNSSKYKAAINLEHASHSNVKQVQWSIISLSGLNFSYSRRVKEAKNEEYIADLRKTSAAYEVKTNVLMQLNKLDSSLDVLNNYNTISTDSLQIYEDSLNLGKLNEDALIETAIGAIRDYRSKVTAHYASLSAYDDFSKATTHNFKVTANENKSAQKQLEDNTLYNFDEGSFKVEKQDGFNSFSLSLNSPYNTQVANVDYIFADRALANRSSINKNKDFTVNINLPNENFPPVNTSGVAIVQLDNGYEFKVNFKF